MGLLAADLLALGNVLRARTARRIFVGHGLTLGVLASVSAMMGDAMLHRPELRAALLQGRDGDPVRTLLGASVAPSFLVAVWFGFGHAWRALFESPELPLWRQAPLATVRPPLQVLLRVLFLCWLWATAMVMPFAWQVLDETAAKSWAAATVPLAVLLCLLPTLCTVMAAQMAMQRFLAGPVAQTLATVLAGAASVGFAAFLTASAFAPGDLQAEKLVDLIQKRPAMPATAGIAADLLAAGTGRPLPPGTLQKAFGWIAGPLALFLLCALWHPRAVEKSVSLGRRRRGRWLRRSWPERQVAAVRRKELAQVLQQPGHLIGMLLFGALIWLFASHGVLVQPILESTLPQPARQVGAMLLLWSLAVLMALNNNMGRIAVQDTAQWSLWQLAPAPAAAILRGKLQALFLVLLWPAALVALVGVHVLGAGLPATLVFAACALFGSLLAIGVLAFVGTLPWLVRPDASGRPGHGARPLLGALMLVLLFELALMPPLVAALALARRLTVDPAGIGEAALQMLTVCGLTALPVFLTGTWLGGRNFARLLLPMKT